MWLVFRPNAVMFCSVRGLMLFFVILTSIRSNTPYITYVTIKYPILLAFVERHARTLTAKLNVGVKAAVSCKLM